MLEAFFSLISLITEHSSSTNISLASVYSLHKIRQIDNHGEGDEGYFIQGDKDMQFIYHVILSRFHAGIFEVENNKYYIFICVFLDLVIQYAMSHIEICVLSGSIILYTLSH